MPITLYGFGPAFGLPSPSPFVLKSDIQLQMLGVDFTRASADLDAVPKHKAPYVRDGEQLIEDSTFIRRHFEHKLSKDLDAGLTPEQRGVAWGLAARLEAVARGLLFLCLVLALLRSRALARHLAPLCPFG